MGRQGEPLGIVQEVWIWPYEQIGYSQPGFHSGEWDTRTPLEFWDTNGSSNFGQTTWICDSQQKKKKNK